MADTPTPPVRDPGPPLGSTADPVGYVPVSWMAVAAFAVMTVYLLVLAALALTAWRSRSPLISPQLLLLPAAAVVLAFAARRMVRNSEGTRTDQLFGVDLINSAWWASVVVGLVYLTYMFAVEFSIQREAKAEVARWVGLVAGGETVKAFHRTRDPGERARVAPDDADALEKRYKNDWITFHLADIVRVAGRNPAGSCEYVPGGLRDWSLKPGGVECVATGTFRSPEGVFPVAFQLRGVDAVPGADAATGRQWQVVLGPNGFLREAPELTPYGEFVFALQKQAREEFERFLRPATDRFLRPFAAVQAAGLEAEPGFRLFTNDAQFARVGLTGVPAGLGWQISDEAYAATAKKLFRQPGGKQPTADQLKGFTAAWNTYGVVPPGVRLKGTPDVHEMITFTDTAVEVRAPVEVPLPSAKSDLAARGRVVMVCTDPAAVAEAKKLRAEASTDRTGSGPPTTPWPRYAWKLDRIESDMRPVAAREEGPGGMPQPGGGGPR